MPTAEETYSQEFQRIRLRYKAAPDREAATREALDRMDLERFARDGSGVDVIYRLQDQALIRYARLVWLFYTGQIEDREYLGRRLAVMKNYAEKLHDRGLVRAVFDAAWIAPLAQRSIDFEREMLPVPSVRDHFGVAESAIFGGPIREHFARFFRRLHRDYGVGRLAERPNLVGGVIRERMADESVDVLLDVERANVGLPPLVSDPEPEPEPRPTRTREISG